MLIDKSIKTGGLPFCLPTANKAIKGCRPGTNGLIFAYVDTGKTSFGVANLCSMHRENLKVHNCDRPIIYAGNEEDIKEVSLRAIQCLTRQNDDEIAKNETITQGTLQSLHFDQIKFVDHVRTMSGVERLLDKWNPRVMYIDQGTKVKLTGQTEVRDVNSLEEVFNNFRELGKIHDCGMVAMAQANAESAEAKYLTLRSLYGSKVAIQGELDWAIGVGVDAENIKYAAYRFFNICKNKKGDKPQFAAKFDAGRCRFKEV
jgi:hypothetical protein